MPLSAHTLLLLVASVAFAETAHIEPATTAQTLLNRNIVYRSPSKQVNGTGLSFDIEKISARVKRNNHFARRTSLDHQWDPHLSPYGQSAHQGNVSWEHGVASGDPHSDSVILWTKVTSQEAHDTDEAICLRYEVSPDSHFSQLVDSDYAWTSSDVDFTCKVEAKSLQPKHEYYYRFSTCHDHRQKSPIGRFKTTPRADDSSVEQLTFAVFSCSNFPFGFFNAYAAAAQSKDVDYALHLGDYLYEKRGDGSADAYGDGRNISRIPMPNEEIVTLHQYRSQHAQYKTDRGSQALLSNKSLIAIWDDHEVADNAWKGGTADSNNTAAGTIHGVKFTDRKRNAVRAYFEYMPVRQVDTTDDLRIWRTFKFGKLVDLMMLDTRQYERDVTDVYYNTPHVAAISNDTQRSLMGRRQEKWFYEQLTASHKRGAVWKLVGQQVIVSPLVSLGGVMDLDAWDGYEQNRERVMNTITSNGINNVLFLSGDSHSAWVNELIHLQNINDTRAYDPSTGIGAIAVEFAGTAVTSPPSVGGANNSTQEYASLARRLVSTNRPVQYAETQFRGYFTLELTQHSALATYWGIPDVRVESAEAIPLSTFQVLVGQNRLTRPLNQGRQPVAGAIQAQTVDYVKQKWNGTAFARVE